MQSPRVCIHVTGFGPFQGVASNPTSEIVSQLESCIAGVIGASAGAVVLGSARVCDTSMGGVAEYFEGLETQPGNFNLFLHLGVAASSSRFQLERCGVNEGEHARVYANVPSRSLTPSTPRANSHISSA